MKRFAKLLLGGALAIAFAASCEPTGTSNTEKPVLVATPESIDATGEDITTFTVLYGEEDVTAESRIFLASDNSELINKNFSTTIPGDYEFYATYNNISSDYVKVTAKGDAVLTVDKSIIEANGTDFATFTVTQDGVDVTSESVLYLIPEEGEPIAQEGFTFSTTEIGVYNFYAQKGSAASNQITITAGPKDPQPDNYNFKERAMITEFTGTWCGYCSLVKATMYELEDQSWDDGVIIEAHSGDIMATTFVNNLINKYGANLRGYPHVTYNMDNQHSSSNYGSIAANRTQVLNNTEQVISAYPCTAGISALFEEGDNENELNVIAAFKFTEPGEYRIAAWLLENGIYSKQANKYPNLVSTEDVSTHRNVLRDVSNSTEFTGDDINMNEAGTYGCSWTFDTSRLYNGDPENSLVAVFVTKKEANGKYVVNNIIKCHFGETVAFEYAE